MKLALQGGVVLAQSPSPASALSSSVSLGLIPDGDSSSDYDNGSYDDKNRNAFFMVLPPINRC